MKKICGIIPVIGVILAAFLLMGFTDVPKDHWAYNAVRQLAEEGTVSGFDDGDFHPGDPVTRAQFVKMLGYRLEEQRKDYITDLSKEHWAYDYLMHSPLRRAHWEILPDEPMTREQAAVYLYDCYGQGQSSDAPSVVTGDTGNKTEIGWAYEHGIMVGDDGLDLRLSDGLTRAEAATLIINAREKINTVKNFAENVPEETLKQVFDGSFLFDVKYDKNAVLTNGQVARAAYRLLRDRVTGLWYENEADFEHEYANDLKAMEKVLGAGRISAKFADMPAQPEDAFAMIAYGVATKIRAFVGYGATDANYRDADMASEALAPALAFAYKNGIRPFAGGVLKTGAPVTHETMAAVLLQYDRLWGLQTSVEIDGNGAKYKDEKMRFTGLPKNAADFSSVLMSVPNEVYDMPYAFPEGIGRGDVTAPYVNYGYHVFLRNAYADFLSEVRKSIAGQHGIEVKFTFYPQLVYDDGEGFTVRAKAEVISAGRSVSAEELFPGLAVLGPETVAEGSVLWVEFPLEYMFFMYN